MKKVITLLSLLLFMSCSNETNETVDTNLRADFLKDKTFPEVKSAYNKLDGEKKVELWNEKLDQIKSQDIDDDVKKIIINLQLELKQEHVDLKAIRKIGIELANILPENQFDDMFIKLEDYNHKLYDAIPVSDDIKIQLKNNKMQIEPNSNTEITSKNIIEDCSCNWTCSTFCPNGSTTNCKPTSSGCGFLWAFGCESSCK